MRTASATALVLALASAASGCGNSGQNEVESHLNSIPGVHVHCEATGGGQYRCPGTDHGKPAEGSGSVK